MNFNFSFFQLVKPIKWHLMLGLFLSCIAALSNFGLLFLSGWLIASAAIVGLTGIIAVQAFNIIVPASGVRFFAITRIVTRYLERVITHDGALRVISLARKKVYECLIPLTPAGLVNKRGGDLLGQFVSDSENIANYYTDALLPFIRALCCGIIFIVTFYFFLPVAAFSLAIAFIMAVGLVSVGVYGCSYKYICHILESRNNLQADLGEILRHFGELYIFKVIDQYFKKIQTAQKSIDQSRLMLDCIESVAKSLITFIMMICVIAVLFQASNAHHDMGLNAAEIPMLVLGVMAAFDVILPLPQACHAHIKARLAQKRLQILSNAGKKKQSSRVINSVSSSTCLVFDKVQFSYPHNPRMILQNASLTIKQGDKVAIIGESGTGKSSLINLIFSFYPIQAGEIKFAGESVKNLNTDNLSSFITVVSQDFHLFSGSIMDNFRLIVPDATENKIYDVLKIVQLDDFVKRLPKNIHSHIGNNAIELSGGEAKRLAIAIALLRKTPWLILDEPTDGLDQQTKYTMMQELLKLYADKTLIIITHETSILFLMNLVFSLENGCFNKVIMDDYKK